MRRLEVQVLILEGGAAGISTALRLRADRVAMVELPESSTAASVWNIGLSPQRVFIRKIRQAGHFMGHKKLITTFAALHRQTISNLEALGIPFRTSNIGKVPDQMSGRQIYAVLQKYLRRTPIQRIQGKVDSFLKDPETGTIVGVSLRGKQGRMEVYFKYAVIAGGGITRFYPYTTNPNRTNGSLLALAADAGIVVQNIEFSMFHPFLITDRRFPRKLFSGTLLTQMTFVDERGKAFLSEPIRRALEQNEHHNVFPQMTREFYLQSLRGNIYAVPHCTDAWFERYKKTNEYGFIFQGHRLKQIKRIRIHPAFHFLIGGIAINERAETSEKNIYAAGEICGGLYGANRFGGTAVSEAWVFGKVAAREINKKLRHRTSPSAHVEPRLVTRVGSLGIHPTIKAAAWRALGPVRDRETLKTFIRLIDRQGHVSSEEKLMKRMAQVSLKRTISVGAFFRRDLPERNTGYNSYCKHDTILFKK